ncbi:hypothetical protein HQ560_01410 [bacterium]|nr:hypothetical protein [bacterium]
MNIFRRTWDVVVALGMLILSVCVQVVFGWALALGLYHLSDATGVCIWEPVLWWTGPCAMGAFNAIACCRYIRGSPEHAPLGAMASVFYYVPRAVDLALRGRKRARPISLMGKTDVLAVLCAVSVYVLVYVNLSFNGRYEPIVVGAGHVKIYSWAPEGFVTEHRWWNRGLWQVFYPLWELDRKHWHTEDGYLDGFHAGSYRRHEPDRELASE